MTDSATALKRLSGLILISAVVSFLLSGGVAEATDFGGTSVPELPPNDPNQPDCSAEGDPAGGGDGEPVNTYSGKWYYRTVDMVVPGVFPIEIVRRHDSNSRYDSPLGYGWAFTYDMRLFEYPDGSVVVRSTCGARHRYVPAGGGFDTPQTPGWRQKLTADGSGFRVTSPQGTKRFFDSQGRLTAIENPQGNRLEFTYDPAGKLPLSGTSPFAVDPTQPMVVARPYHLKRIEERTADGVLPGRYVDFEYDSVTGRLTYLESFDGRRVTYEHELIDPNSSQTTGNLERVIGLAGIEQTFGYADPLHPHKVTSFEDGQGTQPYENTYDVEGRVSTQKFGDRVLAFEYEPTAADVNHPDHLSDCQELVCRVIKRTIVDDQGLNPQIATTVRKYRQDGYPIEVIDAEGNTTRLVYESGRPFLDSIEVLMPDPNSTPSSLTREVFEDLGFDSDGELAVRSVVVETASGGSETITETLSYDSGWLASREVVSSADPGSVFRTEFELDYNPDGRPKNIRAIKERDALASFLTTSMIYEANGQVAAVVLPAVAGEPGMRIAREYFSGMDSKHGLVKEVFVETGGDPTWARDPHLSRSFTYDARGFPASVTNARAHPTTFSWDDAERLTAVTNAKLETARLAYGGPVDPNTSLLDPNVAPPGRFPWRKEVGLTSAEAAGQLTVTRWNAKGDRVEIERRNGSVLESFLTFAYDSDGRELRSTDATGREFARSYDLIGRLSSVTDDAVPPNVTTARYDASGDRVEVVDAKQRRTVFTYDALSRLLRATQEGVTPALDTEFAYDAVGNRVSLTDPKGQTTGYEYDLASRLRAVVPPLDEGVAPNLRQYSVSYEHDARKRLKSATNARGEVLRYKQFSWGLLEAVEYYADPNAVSPLRTVSFGYDEAANVTSLSDSAPPTNGLIATLTYDPLDRLESMTAHYLPHGDVELSSGYDRFGNRDSLSLTEPVGTAQRIADGGPRDHSWVYDDRNRLEQISLPGGSVIDPNSRPNDELETWPHGNGLSTTYSYKPHGPVETIRLGPPGSPVHQLDYTYDALLNVETVTQIGPAGVYAYAYDGIDRLAQATYPAGLGLPASPELFPYDKAGNRDDDPLNPSAWEYDQNNRLLSGPIHSYVSDADGNLETLDPGPNRSEFGWDAANVLQSFDRFAAGSTLPVLSATYTHDPLGRRIWKEVVDSSDPNAPVTTERWYLWDGKRLLAEYDDAGLRQTRYAYAESSAPVEVGFRQSGGSEAIYAVHSDHLETPKLLTDASGVVKWRAAHEAFGRAHIDPDPDGDGDPANDVAQFNIRFPGQYFDAESDLHYNRYRYYDPGVGRYISADPIGQEGGSNVFAYVLNNPLNMIDLLGLLAQSDIDSVLAWVKKCKPELLANDPKIKIGGPFWQWLNQGPGGDRGETSADGTEITLNEQLDSSNAATTITHELQHTLQSPDEKASMLEEDDSHPDAASDDRGPIHDDIHMKAQKMQDEFNDFTKRQNDDDPCNDGC